MVEPIDVTSLLNSSAWIFEVARGRVAGVRGFHKFGSNPAVAGSTKEMLWSAGGNLSWLSAAETMDVTSASAADDVAGTGALTVKLFGLDGDYKEIEETVTMTGAVASTTVATFLRVYRLRVVTAGSGEVNAGEITATSSTAATAQCAIPALEGQSQHCLYTVPAGHTLYINKWSSSLNRATGTAVVAADIFMHIRTPQNVIQLKTHMGLNNRGTGTAERTFTGAIQIPEKTDVYLEGFPTTNSDISGELHGLLIKGI